MPVVSNPLHQQKIGHCQISASAPKSAQIDAGSHSDNRCYGDLTALFMARIWCSAGEGAASPCRAVPHSAHAACGGGCLAGGRAAGAGGWVVEAAAKGVNIKPPLTPNSGRARRVQHCLENLKCPFLSESRLRALRILHCGRQKRSCKLRGIEQVCAILAISLNITYLSVFRRIPILLRTQSGIARPASLSR